MNILKYLLSKNYRHKYISEYSKELCIKLDAEQKQKQDIYRIALNNNSKS